MRFQRLASALLVLTSTIVCSAQVTPLSLPAAPPTADDAVVGAQLYRKFVGTGEGSLVVEPGGRVLIYQRLDLPVDGREWRILAATPRMGANLNQGRADGYFTVKADYREGANRGFQIKIRPWEEGVETLHLYFSLAVDNKNAAPLIEGATVVPVIGVQSRFFTGEQLDAMLADMAELGANDLRDAWSFLLNAAALWEILPPMGGDPRCNECKAGGIGATSCTWAIQSNEIGVTCAEGYYACCGGDTAPTMFAICCPNAP